MLCPFCQVDVDRFLSSADGASGFRCPACGEDGVPLLYPQDYDTHPAVPVSIFGPTGHGKSVFIDALLTHLERRVNWPRFSCQWMDQAEMLAARRRLQLLRDHGQLPDATAAVFPRPQVLRLRDVPAVGGCQLLFFDTSGETFRDVELMRDSGRYLKNSPAVVWLVSLNDLEYPEQLSDLMTTYAQAMIGMGGNPAKQAVVLVLTKGDQLLDKPGFPAQARDFLHDDDLDPAGDSWDKLAALSNALEGWLVRAGQRNVVNLLKGQFRAVRVCVVSAQGGAATDGVLDMDLMPRGVLAPLFWLWRETRPVAWLQTVDERRPFFSLADAVAVARAGATVNLEAGRYKLNARLEVRHPIRVVGRGADETVVESAAPDFVVGVGVGAGAVELRGLTLVHTGAAPADVVRVIKGQVALHGCTLRGGVTLMPKAQGDGVRVTEGAAAAFYDCTVEKNQGSGVAAVGSGRLILNGTAVRENGFAGVWAAGADVNALKCEVVGNGHNGLHLTDRVRATVHKSTFKKNKKNGIGAFKSAAAELHGNTCDENGLDGIVAKDDAVVSADDNKCRKNGQAGVSVHDAVTGAVTNNRCGENRTAGIEVEDRAAPTVDGNACERNRGAGIAYAAAAGGRCVGNTCAGNEGDGIAVGGKAAPSVDRNRCEGNGGAGLRLADGSGAKVGKENQLRNNTAGDVYPPKAGRRGWFG